MIDKPQSPSLHYLCFGVRDRERSPRGRALKSLLAAAMCVYGCTLQPAPSVTEDSLTSGRMSIVCTPDVRGLLDRELAAFRRLYPRAEFEVRNAQSRDAVSALFSATSDLAVIARELEPEEREAAVRGGLELEGYRFARDALLMVVHPSNEVENISVDDIRRIYRGELSRWASLGGTNTPIDPVIHPLSSDIAGFFDHAVMGNEPITVPALREISDSAVVQRVVNNPRAIGYVSLASASMGAKVLRVSSLSGLPYWKPDLEAIYRGDYPLTRYLNAYLRSGGSKLGSGLITYITSFEGQQVVHEAGLVPTTIPVRFVRRSPMIGAHP